VILSADQIRNPEDPTDRGPKRLHAAGGAARAASVQLRKHGCGRVFAAVLARPRQRLGPGVVPLAPFPLVSINTPLGFFRGISRVLELLFCF